jgi:hypothetical protein
MKVTTRETYMVHLLDESKVLPICQKIMALEFGTTPAGIKKEGWEIDGPLVIGRAASRDRETGSDRAMPPSAFAIVGTEGVGWSTDWDQRIPVPLRFGYSSSQSIDVSAKVLWACRSEEQVDLAEHVRSFGSRLESNFALWLSIFRDGDKRWAEWLESHPQADAS